MRVRVNTGTRGKHDTKGTQVELQRVARALLTLAGGALWHWVTGKPRVFMQRLLSLIRDRCE